MTVPRGLAEDLLYSCRLSAEGEQELVGLRCGSLLAGFWFEGPDLEAASGSEVSRLCSAVHDAFELLGQLGGFMVHVETFRCRRKGYLPRIADTVEPTDYVCDRERRAHSAHYEQVHALFVTQLRARDEQTWASRAGRFSRGELTFSQWLSGQDPDTSVTADGLKEFVRDFRLRVSQFGRSLSAAGLNVEPMRTTAHNCELLQALTYCVSGAWHEVAPSEENRFALDVLLARDLVCAKSKHDFQGRLDGRPFQIVEPLRFPRQAFANMLLTLEHLGVEFRLSTRAILLTKEQATQELEGLQGEWDQLRHKFKHLLRQPGTARENGPAATAAEEVGEALEELGSGRIFGAHLTMVVVVFGDTDREAKENARLVEQGFQLEGFSARSQVQNAREALLGSLPGHGGHNVRRPYVSSVNFVHLLALSHEWQGEATIPSNLYPAESPAIMQVASRSGAKFHLNLHMAPKVGAAGKRSEDSAHAAIFGPMGAGKTVLMNSLSSQFLARHPTGRVIFLDNEYSAFKCATARFDGAHFDLGGEGLQLNPFADIHDRSWLAYANSFVAALAQWQGTRFGEEERLAVADTLRRLSQTGCPQDRTLKRLWMELNEPRHVKHALEHYVTGGGAGIVNGERALPASSRFTCFELGELFRSKPAGDALEPRAKAGLHYMFEWIRRSPNGAPTLVIVDEAGLAVQDPVVASRLSELVLVGRKLNVHVVMAFQSPRQLLDSAAGATLRPNLATTFWLPNADARKSGKHGGYVEMRASEGLLDLIETAQRKRDYIYTSGSYTRVFTLNLGPIQQAFWTYGGDPDREHVLQLQRQYGDFWPREYLERRGQKIGAKAWEHRANKVQRTKRERTVA